MASITAFLSGCDSLGGGRLPESVLTLNDPATSRPYLLYRPENYNADMDWPLVVACHGGFGNSPRAQIKMWRELADKYGFLVAAPQLAGGGAVEKLADDERHIVGVVGHVRAGQSISDHRVLMFGQGQGALPALATAIGAPQSFRAIALLDPRLTAEDLTTLNRALDPYQPLFIRYNSTDIVAGKRVQESVDWLRSHGANLRADVFGGRDPAVTLQRVVEFYQHVIRSEPWVSVAARATGQADFMEFSFTASPSAKLQDFHWEFGDGAESTDPQPVHRYSAAGQYNVSLSARQEKTPLRRTITVRVPADGSAIAPAKVP